MQVYLNSHIDSTVKAYEEEAFVPHPATWLRRQKPRTISCSKKAAIEFLSTYEQFDVDVEITFTSVLQELIWVASD
jgi:hypothetical protein